MMPIIGGEESMLAISNFILRQLNSRLDIKNIILRLINSEEMLDDSHAAYMAEDYVEVPCPSHDNPLLMIAKHYRREFFDDLFKT